MLNKLYHKGAEIKSAFLKGVMVFGSSEVPVEPSGDMGLAKDYSGTGWYKATDTGTVFSKDVPALDTVVFEEGGLEYVSVYTKEDAKLYGERAVTSNVTDMSSMFYDDTEFNQDISSWDVSNVTDMSYMFYNSASFNQDISSWDVSNVTNIGRMFQNAASFNQDISSWDVSNVTNMSGTFSNATSFNQDISSWDVSNVTDMTIMLYNATSFNQDLSQWCVTKIESAPDYFNNITPQWTLPKPVWGTCPRGEDGSIPETPEEPDTLMGLAKDYSGTGWYKATDTGTVFSKDVPELETHVFSDSPKEYVSVYTKEDAKLYDERAATSNLTNMSSLFYNEYGFNQDISSWDVSNVVSMNYMFGGCPNFNQDISSWDVSNVTDMSTMFYNATSFNQDLSSWDVSSATNMGNMFFDARQFNQDLSKWCVSLIPTKPNNFDSSANSWTLPRPVWGTCPRHEDGSVPVIPEETNTLIGLREDYSGTGWYKATDTGTVFSKDVPEGETKVFEEGGLEYISVYTVADARLYGARAATSNLTSMSYYFFNNASFNEDISSWDVSSVTDMTYMFGSAISFNQDISKWDVSNVTNMSYMFSGATSFNQDLSSWSVSSVADMYGVFFNATAFNSDISAWNVSNVTYMATMFENATSFNQDLSKWCVSLISTKPDDFDTSATAWTLPKPVWGTCPRGENTP